MPLPPKSVKSLFGILLISLGVIFCQSARAGQTTLFSSSLVLDLPLNGSTADTGPYDFTIITNGGGTWVPDQNAYAGLALALNGVNQNISIPFDSRLYPTEHTLSIWVKLQQLSGSIWRAGNASSDGWCGWDLSMDGPNLSFHDYTGSYYNAILDIPLTNLSTETWYQIVVTRTTNSCSIFVNGIKQSSQTGLSPYKKPQFVPMLIGANYSFDDSLFAFCPMTIDRVHIYNRALSDSDVTSLYLTESTGTALPYINVKLSLNFSSQGTSKVTGDVSTTKPPDNFKLTTEDILNVLAADKHAQGSWPSDKFPTNATLALAGSGFAVVDGTNILSNVSDILSLSKGEPKIVSGKQNTVTGLAANRSQSLQIAGLRFDDTFIEGGSDLKFYANGVLNTSTMDTKPVDGIYTETQFIILNNAAGDGWSKGVPFICTGSVFGMGTSSLNL